MRASRGMGDMSATKMRGARNSFAKGGKPKLDISKAIKKPGALRSALGTKKGEQFVKQPKAIARKTAKYR